MLHNAGTVRKSAGSGTAAIYVRLDNTGTVEAQSGTLALGGGGTWLGGGFTTAAGAGINFSAGTFVEVLPLVVTGAGTTRLTGATVALLGPWPVNLELAVATFVGSNALSGVINWTGGSIEGALTLATNGVLNLSGAGTKHLSGVLTNAGTVVLAGTGDVYFYSAAALYNLAGGLVDIQADQALSASGTPFLDNAGVVRKSAGSGTAAIYVRLDNTGTVEADTGTINIQGGFSNSPTASLAISLGGAAPGSDYGHIHFTSPLTTNGIFTTNTRNGFRPSPGDTFQVLSYPPGTGAFPCLTGLDLGGGIILQPQFTATSLTLVAASYTPGGSLPQLLISRSLNSVAVQWPLGFPGWVLESCTNLASPIWAPVPGACDNEALVPVTAPQQYFRLQKTD